VCFDPGVAYHVIEGAHNGKREEGMEISIALVIWSSAFGNGDIIPARYTADGEDISPPLEWECSFDAGSFALVCEDPDAPMGTWVHWVIYNIPGGTRSLEEGIPGEAQLRDGILQGTNSWGRIGYGGPAPPSGKHRYFFTLYALQEPLDLSSGATAEELRQAMEGLVMRDAQFMGEYTRD
jgi:Raf kinase inhibitor-like YbhB/YbcL family protein